LIDTTAFFDLKTLVLAALSQVEASHFNQRHQVTLSRVIVEEEKDDLLKDLYRFCPGLASEFASIAEAC
jgi:hypothetical protein